MMKKKGLLAASTKTTKRKREESEKQADAAEKQRLESKMEWETLMENEQVKKRRVAMIEEAQASRQIASYADMEEDDGAQEAIDEEDRQRKLAKKFGKQDEDDDDNDDGIGAREGAAAANGSAGAEGDADGVQRKARGTRGNKEAKRKKKEQKKKEQEEELKRKKEEKKKKIDGDPDRYLTAAVSGEQKPRKIDTKRLCKYRDFDEPEDLRAKFEGNFRQTEREVAGYDDL